MPAEVGARLVPLLAEVLERDAGELGRLPPDTPLLAGLGLDSLTGMRLLAALQREFGVDVAADDLGLDCLETIGTLTGYLAAACAGRA
jgi:acyl carrier protein